MFSAGREVFEIPSWKSSSQYTSDTIPADPDVKPWHQLDFQVDEKSSPNYCYPNKK